MPPTFMVHSGPLMRSCPRARSSSRTLESTRDSSSTAPAVVQPRARRLDRLLQRQAEIDVLHHRLHLGLQDAVAAGRAQRQHRPVVLVTIEGATQTAIGSPCFTRLGLSGFTSAQ